MAAQTAGCSGCPIVFRTMGNLGGHCSGCHRTFRGLSAFDRHQTISDGKVTCHDPAGMPNTFESVVIDHVTYWSLTLSDADRQRLAALKSTDGDPSAYAE